MRSPSPDSTRQILLSDQIGELRITEIVISYFKSLESEIKMKKGIRGQNEDSLSPDCSRPSRLCSLLSTGWFDLNCHYLNMSSRVFLLEEKVPSL